MNLRFRPDLLEAISELDPPGGLTGFLERAAEQALAGRLGGPVVVYGLVDPRSGDVRYVGHTTETKRRLRNHVNHARREKPPNAHLAAWLNDLAAEGLEPELRELERVATADAARAREAELVAELGDQVTNMHYSGQWVTLYGFDPEVEAAMREAAAAEGASLSEWAMRAAREALSMKPKGQRSRDKVSNGMLAKAAEPKAAAEVVRKTQRARDDRRTVSAARSAKAGVRPIPKSAPKRGKR